MLSKQQLAIFNSITTPLGNELTWRWDAEFSALLTEFSWEKKVRVLQVLQQLFSEQWHKGNIKKAPKVLHTELAELAQLNKNQLIFTRRANHKTPALALIWWPWGHGSTYSMRIKILNGNYNDEDLRQGKTRLFSKVLKAFQRR
ncbi:hypothetical protein SAMN05216262_12725 [Colwellia chukchiensis]|uniref:Uncharacterized protein n=1 Tax=Colwellia chukchiensis TaxID=641665 RepID=A0A1H7TNN9_9GAMM|nr:hypothetical protein [Colwellia chukchiensis]SEL86460.1 hypothetical protein SAMN05216262_12725 [Colwellia chukchiensis]